MRGMVSECAGLPWQPIHAAFRVDSGNLFGPGLPTAALAPWLAAQLRGRLLVRYCAGPGYYSPTAAGSVHTRCVASTIRLTSNQASNMVTTVWLRKWSPITIL
jgi:hypothetical protein